MITFIHLIQLKSFRASKHNNHIFPKHFTFSSAHKPHLTAQQQEPTAESETTRFSN